MDGIVITRGPAWTLPEPREAGSVAGYMVRGYGEW